MKTTKSKHNLRKKSTTKHRKRTYKRLRNQKGGQVREVQFTFDKPTDSNKVLRITFQHGQFLDVLNNKYSNKIFPIDKKDYIISFINSKFSNSNYDIFYHNQYESINFKLNLVVNTDPSITFKTADNQQSININYEKNYYILINEIDKVIIVIDIIPEESEESEQIIGFLIDNDIYRKYNNLFTEQKKRFT